jgi:hypothetical protein
LIAAGGKALAVEVSGKLLLATYRPEPTAPVEQAFLWEIENGVKEVTAERVEAQRELAVVLIGEGSTTLPERVEVAFSGGGLLPSTIVVRPNTTLLFRNEDEIAHELYAEGVEGFAAEGTSPRGRRSVVLKEAGTFALRDRIITHLTGYVHVMENVIAVASPDGSGQFVFPEVPAGKYTLKVLHGPSEIASQTIEVGTRELTIDPLTLAVAPKGDKAASKAK